MALSSVVWAGEVWYVPGWMRTAEMEGLAYTSCTNVYSNSVCRFRGWDGDRMWGRAVKNADAEAVRLAEELAQLDDAARRNLTLVGHSLGGRIIARALVRLAEKDLTVGSAVLLAPAIPMKDADVVRMGRGSETPVLLLVNPHDVTLKYVYTLAGGEDGPSLGTDGTPWELANVRQYAVPADITRTTTIDAPWGKSETFKRLCNHLAAFYFTELQRIRSGERAETGRLRIPQDNVNLEWKVVDAGIWWRVVDTCQGWKLERHILTGHARIISPEKVRYAWGSLVDLRYTFNAIRFQLRTNRSR